ncbi:MAG: hypothetical protein PHX21_13245 [bacterium]|nr:hypothetical protein [bacterium]
MRKENNVYAPCKRSRLYVILITPILISLVLIFIYLWTINPLLSFIFLGIWVLTNILEGYCCAIMECPHSGKWCHPIGGFLFSGFISKMLFHNKINRVSKTSKVISFFATFSAISWGVFPIYWLAKLNIFWAIAFPLICLVYVILHICLICPVCALNEVCVMAKIKKGVCKE